MKRLSISVCLMLVTTIIEGQNLVPNGDFEIIGTIPCGWAGSATSFNNSTSGWTSPTEGTPDIHSTQIPQNCTNHHPNSTAVNSNGSQMPFSGNTFAGSYAYALDNLPYREYLQTQLLSPLQPGNKYIVEMYVSLADHSQYASDQIGIGFSTTITNNPNYLSLGYTPDILFNVVVSDSINWVLLVDTIIPSQPYQYMIIGNFFDELNTNQIIVNPSAYWQRSYYYFDNISVTLDTTVNIAEIKDESSFFVFPNPSSDSFTIEIKSDEVKKAEIEVYNILGSLVKKQSQHLMVGTNKIMVPVHDLPNGNYFLMVKGMKESHVSRICVLKQ